MSEMDLRPPASLRPRVRTPAFRASSFYGQAYVYFALAFLAAFIGFFPTYFSKLRESDAVHHLHGITASVWMIGLVTQSWLMSHGHIALHRRLGKASLLLVPLFVVSGLMVVHVMLSSNSPFAKAFGARLAFTDLTTILCFAGAYVLAIYHRRSIQLHARYMASTAVLVLPPALARILGNYVPGIDSFEAAFHGGFFLAEGIVALLLVADFREGRVYAPYAWLAFFLIFQQLSFLVSPIPSWWMTTTVWFGRL